VKADLRGVRLELAVALPLCAGLLQKAPWKGDGIRAYY
jgi:hypothetical protein